MNFPNSSTCAAWTNESHWARPKLPHLEAMPMPFRPGLTGAATLAFRREEEMLQDVPDDDLEAYYCRLIKPLKAKNRLDYMRKQPSRVISLSSMRPPVAASRRAPTPVKLIFLNPPGNNVGARNSKSLSSPFPSLQPYSTSHSSLLLLNSLNPLPPVVLFQFSLRLCEPGGETGSCR